MPISRPHPAAPIAHARRDHRLQQRLRAADEIRPGDRDRRARRSTFGRAAPTRRATWRIARRICVRSRVALDGVYDGPDGRQGTDDDFDAILHLGNANAGRAGEGGLSRASPCRAASCALDADAGGSADQQSVPVDITFAGPGVLGAAADRARVRVRAGDAAPRAAREHAAVAERRRATIKAERREATFDLEPSSLSAFPPSDLPATAITAGGELNGQGAVIGSPLIQRGAFGVKLLFWRKWHRWIGFPAAIFLLWAATTGFLVAFTEFFGEAEALREATRDLVSPVTHLASRLGRGRPDRPPPSRRSRRRRATAPIDSITIQFKGDQPTVSLFTGKPAGGEDRRFVVDARNGALIRTDAYVDKPFLNRLHSGEAFGDGGLVFAMAWALALVTLRLDRPHHLLPAAAEEARGPAAGVLVI